ncbi:hypothetical protein Msip34_2865 (plasmid) [Methylovorus glucosotrophus SIP3-4]|uniref:Pyocin activator protein PrtN n=1 Tax=Methylovorus glucosotrophus (strain SIP3-4) TaxID=582744 RepID=C6XEN2_METGS|nr:hypothetical protein Msip34_2865 [Methylovorus glucosotrophus SIP3-4]
MNGDFNMTRLPTTLEILLFRFNGQLMIPFVEGAKVVGFEAQTARNQLSKNSFPIETVMNGGRRFIHIRELASYVDKLTNSQYPSVAPLKAKRGRPTKAEQLRKAGRLPEV